MYDITKPAVFDRSTESYKYTMYYPTQGSDLNGFSDLRISIQGRDYFYHPSNAYLTIKGDLFKKEGDDVRYGGTELIAMVNLAPLFLFSKMTLRIGGRDVESVDNVGHTVSAILNLMNTSSVAKAEGLSYCWYPDTSDAAAASNKGFDVRMKYLFNQPKTKGRFSFSIPLRYIFGFCFDYDKLIFGYDMELILIWQNDYFALHRKKDGTYDAEEMIEESEPNVNVDQGKIKIKSIVLSLPIATPTTERKVQLLEIVKNKTPISINFCERKGLSIDIPTGLQSFDWQFSTISLPKRPKYLFVLLQDHTATDQTESYALFTNRNVDRMSVSVNNTIFTLHEHFPADFGENDFNEFYRAFVDVRQNLFGLDNVINQSHVSPSLFKSLYTIFSFDLSRHREEFQDQTISSILHIHFKTALTKTLRCFVVTLSEKEIVLTGDGRQIATI